MTKPCNDITALLTSKRAGNATGKACYLSNKHPVDAIFSCVSAEFKKHDKPKASNKVHFALFKMKMVRNVGDSPAMAFQKGSKEPIELKPGAIVSKFIALYPPEEDEDGKAYDHNEAMMYDIGVDELRVLGAALTGRTYEELTGDGFAALVEDFEDSDAYEGTLIRATCLEGNAKNYYNAQYNAHKELAKIKRAPAKKK